ncbi:hypothetical protein CsSME_00002219 [Camellia sinensis var. sinensis]|uniref:Phosphate-induced protein 1 n=1 Tax=Camellia sinensis TaxID=4442 RepID=A0A7J7FPG3_CAMSI|nr:hypothetical protein HYC85_000125 [Camellia sinensis]
MESSLPNTKTLLALSLIITTLCITSFTTATATDITYHGGPLLSGNVSLTVLWYGQFQPIEKRVIRNFVKSLSLEGVQMYFQPHVSCWWRQVESYIAAADGKKSGQSARVNMRIVREVDDENASVGKALVSDLLPGLLKKATAGLPNTIAVIFAAKDVSVLDTCKTSTCYDRGVIGKQLYIVVGNPEEQCPGLCAVPYHKSDVTIVRPAALTLEPASGDIGADAMLVQFASALTETVTNPFNTGYFFSGLKLGKTFLQAASACEGAFASGAMPGYPGNVRVDPDSGGAFNAHGFNNSKFLLPALWDLKTSSCWTTL